MIEISKDKKYRERDLGYMAGIIDGEGSISVTDLSVKYNRSFFTTSVGVTSTDEIMIDWIVDVFGGWKSEYTPKQTPANSRKKVYRWQITGKNLEVFLSLIEDYVVVKKEEIRIMLKIRSTFGKSYGGKKVSSEINKQRRDCAKRLKEIHCRGYVKKNRAA